MDLSQFSLEGKTAIVTGAGRGIGKAASLALANAGADIVVAAKTVSELEETAAEVRKLGRRSLVVPTDLGKMDQLQPLVDKTVAEFGTVDILINNGGINFPKFTIEMEEADWDRLMNIDLKGTFFLSQAAARVMKEHGGGKIVNVASVAGVTVEYETGHYSIAKAGLIMATKVMAREWAQYGIRANCIAPGSTRTKFFDYIFFDGMSEEEIQERLQFFNRMCPLGRVADPSEMAGAIIYFCSEASSYTTGQTMVIDGGTLL